MSEINNETPKDVAERLFIDCYPNWYDNGQFMKTTVAKDYCKKNSKCNNQRNT